MISQVANELKSGDLCSPLGDKSRYYRQQLIPWDQFKREVSVYGEQTGIPTEAKQFVQSLQEKLISTSRNTDERFPQNESVRIEDGEPILSPLCARHDPEDLKLVEFGHEASARLFGSALGITPHRHLAARMVEYLKSQTKTEEFVLYSAAARNDLGEKVQ